MTTTTSLPGAVDAMVRLNGHLATVPSGVSTFSREELLQKPGPGKWSKQEILGHLIDSAINNLRRFTEIQFLPQPFTVVGYRQEELVQVNQYQVQSPEHLLNLWGALNRQVIQVVTCIPEDKLSYIVIIKSGESMTLDWLIVDYVDHLEHHLRQIFG